MKQFEFSLQPDLYRRQNVLYFKRQWTKFLKSAKTFLILGAILLLLGISIALTGADSDTLLFTGFILAYTGYLLHAIYRKSKKSFEKAVNERITDWEKHRQNTLVEYDDESIRMLSPTADIKLHWKGFKSYFTIEETLYLISDVGIALIVAESQAGTEIYAELVRIAGSKMKQS